MRRLWICAALVVTISASTWADDAQVAEAKRLFLLNRPGEVERVLREPSTPLAKAMRALAILKEVPGARALGQTYFNPEEAAALAKESLGQVKAMAIRDPFAEAVLGRMYRYGAGVEKDQAKALGLLQSAASRGEGSAFLYLASMHDEGGLVPKDEAAKARWLRKGADSGDTRAMTYLAADLMIGKVGQPDLAESVALTEMAAKAGNPTAMQYCAAIYGNNANASGKPGSLERASGDLQYAWLEKAAALGHVGAMLSCADLCIIGGVSKVADGNPDEALAFEWRRKASLSDLPFAVYELADCYMLGIGCKPDLKTAFTLLDRAKMLGKDDPVIVQLVDDRKAMGFAFTGKGLGMGGGLTGLPGAFNVPEPEATAAASDPAPKPMPKKAPASRTTRAKAAPRREIPEGTVLAIRDLVESRKERSSYTDFAGRGTNMSSRELQNVSAEIQLEGANGRLVGTVPALVTPNPIGAGGGFSFSGLQRDVPAHARIRVVFSFFGGADIPSYDTSVQ
jgi:TPR repeat protein